MPQQVEVLGWPKTAPEQGNAVLDSDGRGAIPGYLIAETQAFLNPAMFCAIINGTRLLGYNDDDTLSQVTQCATCTAEEVNVTFLGTNPSSLERLSNKGSTIEELEGTLTFWTDKD